jgi:hypothetical protein
VSGGVCWDWGCGHASSGESLCRDDLRTASASVRRPLLGTTLAPHSPVLHLMPAGEPLPDHEKCWNNAVPTLGHMAVLGLLRAGRAHAVVSQNIDGTRCQGLWTVVTCTPQIDSLTKDAGGGLTHPTVVWARAVVGQSLNLLPVASWCQGCTGVRACRVSS